MWVLIISSDRWNGFGFLPLFSHGSRHLPKGQKFSCCCSSWPKRYTEAHMYGWAVFRTGSATAEAAQQTGPFGEFF
jgi:hypothetical protein